MTAGRVATDHIDIFFLFFIQLAIAFSILFAQRQKAIFNILAGISLGAAILSKWLPALIVVPIWLLIIMDTGKFKPKVILLQLIILLTTCVLIFLPWQLYILQTFPTEANWEATFNVKHFTEVLDGRTGPFYYFIDRIRINYGELIYLPLIWFLWKTLKDIRNKKRIAISVWFFIPLLFFSAAKTKMQGYILFICPALFMMTAEFFFALSDYKRNHKLKWVFNLILILLVALPVRYMIERVKPFERSSRNPDWVKQLRDLKEKKVANGVLLNYDHPTEAMFYTNLTAYQSLPDENEIVNMVANGYTVIINDNGQLPDYINTIKGITIERLSSH